MKNWKLNVANLIFETDSEIVCDINIHHQSNREFEIKGIKCLINKKDIDDLPSQSKDGYSGDPIHIDMKR